MPGPAKTPRHLKLLKGTLQPCRDRQENAGIPALDSATPPAWMTDIVAVAEFKRLAAVLAVNKLLTAGNTALLAHLCMLHARITSSWAEGATPTASLMTVYRRLCGDLGLSHMAAPAPATKPNRFLLNWKRR